MFYEGGVQNHIVVRFWSLQKTISKHKVYDDMGFKPKDKIIMGLDSFTFEKRDKEKGDMVQQKGYFAFISDKWKIIPTVNSLSCRHVVLLRSSICVPLLLLWLSYETLKHIFFHDKLNLVFLK